MLYRVAEAEVERNGYEKIKQIELFINQSGKRIIPNCGFSIPL